MSAYHDNPEVRLKIDELLRRNATIQSNLGLEHAKNSPERKQAKAEWRELLKQIRQLDSDFAKVVELQE
jgi:low affinity Fe/Cu permease